MKKGFYLYGVTDNKNYLIGSYNTRLEMAINRRKWSRVGFDWLFVEREKLTGAQDLRKEKERA